MCWFLFCLGFVLMCVSSLVWGETAGAEVSMEQDVKKAEKVRRRMIFFMIKEMMLSE